MWKKFMLPLHKQKRIQRLLRLPACDGGSDTQRQTAGSPQATAPDQDRRLVRGLLDTLDHDSLKMLCEVIESRGGVTGACVRVPNQMAALGPSCCAAVVVFCRYFRWPEVEDELRLRRLYHCNCVEDKWHQCINPYHWSLVYTPVSDSPPPAGSVSAKRSSPVTPLRSASTGSSESTPAPESQTTGGTEQYATTSADGGLPTWCRLFYFERRRRVGQLGGWPARRRQQHVFYSLPHGDGLSLSSVAEQNPQPEPDVLRTRPQIGAGLTLTLELYGVWLYNRSERALFVSSPTLDPPSGAPAEAVHKLPPGYSVLVYVPPVGRRRRPPDARDGPRDPASVTVSFVKGWGPKYTRRSPTECPCWLELCFSLPTDPAR